ncbi:hypothetical protein GGQ74_002740 [Desulfobaculum xiamenense]|uniref:Uncharacterized protein n=1 Tax=Desulfobaculum xiamenense TaxID=995050 RepID=A0A846QJJ6_9BACT|nr:hypothetical protein [Desulfobaculum xiamenense]NJB69046.1 hypothetical protein [Desulfobaculum xiamenense]
MPHVVSLDAYRAHRQTLAPAPEVPPKRPVINDGQIFARNYSDPEGLVFAVLKIREVLRYHMRDDDGWQPLALAMLDAAYHFEAARSEALADACRALKDYMLAGMTPDNASDMTAALLLCDLIEKSPARRSAPDI